MQDIIKWILLLILFFPVFYYAFREKKWYLYLTCAFIGILPDEFAIELSASLPLLTAERILILVLFGFWFFKKWKERTFSFPLSLLIYFGVNVVISLVNLHFGISGELKRVLILALERILLILMLIDFVEDREELDKCVDAMILSCVAMSLIGIVQTIFEFDIASVLKLVDTRYDSSLTIRMGIIRAFGTSNAIIYGCYCAFMSMLIYYRLERTGKQRYALFLALDLVALICTLSRSSWLCIVGIIGLIFVIRPRKFVKRVWTSILLTLLICVSLFFVKPDFQAAITETGKSSLNTVLSALNIQLPTSDRTDPDDTSSNNELPFDISEEFGANANHATRSRIVEWTAVSYMIDEGHGWFGYGYNAFLRGMLHYLYPQFGYWITATTLDVGLLAIVTESGFIGLAAHLLLLGYIFVVAFRKRGENGTFSFHKLVIYMIPMYLMLNFMSAFTGAYWLFFGLFYAAEQLDRKGLKDAGRAAPVDKWLI